jgi:hypothetical protein
MLNATEFAQAPSKDFKRSGFLVKGQDNISWLARNLPPAT